MIDTDTFALFVHGPIRLIRLFYCMAMSVGGQNPLGLLTQDWTYRHLFESVRLWSVTHFCIICFRSSKDDWHRNFCFVSSRPDSSRKDDIDILRAVHEIAERMRLGPFGGLEAEVSSRKKAGKFEAATELDKDREKAPLKDVDIPCNCVENSAEEKEMESLGLFVGRFFFSVGRTLILLLKHPRYSSRIFVLR